MIASDETALICDLAECYGILDYRALPVKTLAALASGLREDSRSKRKLAGVPVETTTLLLAMAVDALNWLVWSRSKAADRGGRAPRSMTDALLHPKRGQDDKPARFRSGAEFERAWSTIARKVRKHGKRN